MNQRNNSFDLLRLILASFVLISHSFYLKHLSPADIQIFTKNQTYLGEIGLLGFFSLSGFLITKSFNNKKDILQFLIHRILRIYPGFWMCLFITSFIIAPIIYLHDYGQINHYPFTGPYSAYTYIRLNFFVNIKQANIAGILNNTDIKNLNGSLWTLLIELGCYFLTIVLGLVGLFNKKHLFLLIFIAWYLFFVIIGLKSYFFRFDIIKLITAYSSGMLIFVFRDRLIDKKIIPYISILLITILTFSNHIIIFLPLVLGFFCINTFNSLTIKLPADLSYGIYIYAYPIQQMINDFFPSINLVFYIVITFFMTLILAFLSFYLIEKPALNQKNRVYGKLNALIGRI